MYFFFLQSLRVGTDHVFNQLLSSARYLSETRSFELQNLHVFFPSSYGSPCLRSEQPQDDSLSLAFHSYLYITFPPTSTSSPSNDYPNPSLLHHLFADHFPQSLPSECVPHFLLISLIPKDLLGLSIWLEELWEGQQF